MVGNRTEGDGNRSAVKNKGAVSQDRNITQILDGVMRIFYILFCMLIFNSAVIQAEGLIVPDTSSSPINKLKEQAVAGNAIAQDQLGFAYLYDNQGVQKDDAEAVVWFRKAAEQGFGEGQFHLGQMYMTGRGVPRDDKEAAKYYLAAAQQGHYFAALNLSNLYVTGRGVPKDEIEAYVWCKISSLCHLDEIKKNFSSEMIAKAEKRYLEQIEFQKSLPKKDFLNTPNPVLELEFRRHVPN